MATLATKAQWGSTSPKIYFDFSYDKKRSGSTQCYAITVSCRPLTDSSSYFGYPIYVEISLDGVVKTSYTLKTVSPNRWSTAISSTTGWLEVANKTSGTTSLQIRIYSGLGSTRTGTYTYSLAVDPAASTISSTPATIGGKPTINISKATSAFTHTVTYAFGNISGTIATKTTATTINSWTIPESFYAQIPNAKTGSCVLTCTSYSGDTAVGTTTCSFVVSTEESVCKPSVSGTVEDTNSTTIALTGNKNILVRYCSTALCKISASAKNSASISATLVNNLSISGQKTIPAVETGVFTFYAKDSRGYTNSDTEIYNIIPYERLTADVSAKRTDPTSGNVSLTISGNYYNDTFGAVNNHLLVKYRLNNEAYVDITPAVGENKYIAAVEISGADYMQSHTIEVVVEDAVSKTTTYSTIPKGIPVFDWGEDDFNFNVPVYIKGVELAEYVAAAMKQNGTTPTTSYEGEVVVNG